MTGGDVEDGEEEEEEEEDDDAEEEDEDAVEKENGVWSGASALWKADATIALR